MLETGTNREQIITKVKRFSSEDDVICTLFFETGLYLLGRLTPYYPSSKTVNSSSFIKLRHTGG